MTKPSGNLLHNLLFFGRLLRAMGLDVQPDGVSNLVKATKWISIDRRQDFYYAARGLLVRRQQDLLAFDRAFERFWRADASWKLHTESEPPGRPAPAAQSQVAASLPCARMVRPQGSAGERPATIELGPHTPEPRGAESTAVAPRVRYSPAEVLRNKDFAQLDTDELEAVKPLLVELAWRLGSRRTRRWRRGRGHEIDVRQLLRQSLRYGGEPLQLPQRSRRSKPRRLVVIADISGSMERYSSLLLHFIFGLSESLGQRTEAFVFGTRLTRISRQMRGHDVGRTLGEVARRVPDWSGGTRIGQALKTFNFSWARRVLARGAVMLLVSDGWDRGDVGLLRVEMARLQRSSYRLIWLNPLLGSADYEPRTRGMQAALPFVDDFLPIHNLSSVEDLAMRLETLEERRPVRKQQPASILQRLI
ncbi:MAG: VWA domain-containing protein [Anaerolineales bacterium]